MSVGTIVGASPASAHALAVSSTPPAGATLADSPRTVTIVFSESPDPRLSSVQVLDSAGGAHQLGPSTAVAGQQNTLQVAVGSLSPGIYTVTWRTISMVDGHLASGSFAFGVKVTPTGAAAASAVVRAPPASTWAVAARWFFYVGTMGLVGAALIGTFVGSLRRLRWIAFAAWLLAAGGVVALEEQQRRSDGIPLGKLLSSSLGHQVLWRSIPLACGAAALVWMAGRTRSRLPLHAVGAAGLATMFGDVEASHVSGERSWRWFHLLTQWVHFASAGLWLGGLVILLGTITEVESSKRPGLVARFSTVALVSVFALATTGVLRGLDEIRSWHGLFDTTFGRWAIVKVSLLLVLIGLGVLQRTRGVPLARRGAIGLVRRTGTGELVLAGVVLVAVGFLQSLAPPSATSAPKSPPPLVASGQDFATTVRARLQISPGSPGFNRFTLRALDYDTRRPIGPSSVSLTFDLPARPDLGSSTVTLTRQPDGTYSVVSPDLSVSGTWTVDVLVQRGSQSAEIPLTVTTRRVPLKVDVSRSPGLPTVYTIHATPAASFQVYLDPGKPGFDEFHVTVLSPGGNEVPTSQLAVHASNGPQPSVPLTVRPLDTVGHYVADLPNVTSGRYQFSIDATTNEGPIHADITIAIP
ncbi:MAG TPA: copper resistance protein CopC [Acidimicrobiales bacterium]|nr:copper resistance protein CopC [Acidimicrobiales bacterium]